MIETILHKKIHEILIDLYGDNDYSIQFQSTRKEFEGDITLVVFPFTRFSKLNPEITAVSPLANFAQLKISSP